MHVPGDRKAVAGERDGRLDRLRPRDGAEPGQRLVQPRHRAWNSDRLVADVVHPPLEHVAVAIRGLADEPVSPLVLSRAPARGRVELEQSVAGPNAMHEHHAAAAEAAHLGIDHALHEGACDGRVDRIATAPHDLQPDLGRSGLRADDDGHTTRVMAAT